MTKNIYVIFLVDDKYVKAVAKKPMGVSRTAMEFFFSGRIPKRIF